MLGVGGLFLLLVTITMIVALYVTKNPYQNAPDQPEAETEQQPEPIVGKPSTRREHSGIVHLRRRRQRATSDKDGGHTEAG